jgi:N-sulfoglucosamine sulfohydrolase
MTRRPNILIITFHDLGRFLGCYGHETVQSPHIDALADEGILFEKAFCTAPQCSPSRAALFTGRYPHSNGVMGLTHGGFAWDLAPDEKHLGQILQEAGYHTALLGIHHESRRHHEVGRIAARCGMNEIDLAGNGESVTQRALDTMARLSKGSKPFYLQVGYREPHRQKPKNKVEKNYMGFTADYMEPDSTLGVSVPPYLVDNEKAWQEVAELQGAVRYVDECVGRLLAGLAELGLAQNTLVILTTDHGVALPRAKCTLYDPGLEVALIMRLPGIERRGRISDLVSNIDIVPTILELLDLPVEERIQGRSLLGLLAGKPEATRRRAIFGELTYHEYYDPMRCIRTETHKLIVNFSSAPSFMDCSQSWWPRTQPVVPEDPRTTYHPPVELYDLTGDPFESRNIADLASAQAVRDALLAELYNWMQATDDPLLHGPVPCPMHHRAMKMLTGAASI